MLCNFSFIFKTLASIIYSICSSSIPFLNTTPVVESSDNISSQFFLNRQQITIIMTTVEYMTRGFVHIVESPPESQWLRLRGPPVENVNLARGPTTLAEIWQMRYNRHLRSLLVEIWLNEYREGWSVSWLSFFSQCCFLFLLDLLSFYLLTTFLVTFRKLFRIESPFFEMGDILNDGTEVGYFRSVVVFARFAPNEA